MRTVTAESGTNNLVHAPAVGGDVRVRAIPPKLLRAIHEKATRGGEFDFQELMVWKLVYGLADPNFTEDEAREVTGRWSLRTLQPVIDRIDSLSGTDEHLRQGSDHLPFSVRKLTEPVMMATAWLQRFPVGSRGRAPRPATNQRCRGSKRTTGSGSTSSGEDGDPPSTPPGESARRCSECDRDISDMRRDATVCREESCRKAAQRSCDRIDPATGLARGHTVARGKCERCGKSVTKQRSEWRIRRLRRPPRGDAPEVEQRDRGSSLGNHSPGPCDRDIYGYGGDAGEPFGERPLRVSPTTPTTIEDPMPDWRLIYARRVAQGELTIEGARRMIAAIERDRARAA